QERRGEFYLDTVARLRPGVTLEEAASEMEAIARRLADQYPETNAGVGFRLGPMRAFMTRDVGTQLVLLLGAVIFVQLIACANVANLLLARGAARGREFAVRLALGAPRSQVIR